MTNRWDRASLDAGDDSMLLECDDVGPGPVVVLLHGFPLDSTMWEHQKGAIGSRYRVIAFDLRGHGRSVAPEGPYSIDGMADDVIESLDAMNLTHPIVLGGLSMGGYVALSLIARHPERVKGLMLMDTRASADPPDARATRLELAAQVETARNTEPVVGAMLPRLFSPTTRARRGDLVARVGERMRRTPVLGVVGALHALANRPDRTADLARIAVPTLAIVGHDDVITPPTEMRAMTAKIPNARLVEVADAGHLAPLEEPGPVNEAVLAFLNTVHPTA